MKRLLSLAFVCIAVPALASNYYIRDDGGVNVTVNASVYCDGTADAAASGHSGGDHHCAWAHPFYALTSGGAGWRFSGGDSLIFALNGSGTAGSYQIGCGSQAATDVFASTCTLGYSDGPFLPRLPDGTDSSTRTKVYGADQANGCRTGKMPELWGSTGNDRMFDLGGRTATSWSDVVHGVGISHFEMKCLEMNDHYACGWGQDYGNCVDQLHSGARTALVGMYVTDIVFDNLYVHGLMDTGIHVGPVDTLIGTNLALIGNGGNGWEFDPGNGATGAAVTNLNTISLSNFVIALNGAVEPYPAVTLTAGAKLGDLIKATSSNGMTTFPYQLPTTYTSDNGSGDGLGTVHTGGTWTFDIGWFLFNNFDGLDMLYCDQQGCNLTVNRIFALGNGGNQLKVSGTFKVHNNIVVGNCAYAQGQGVPHAQYCRAGGISVAMVSTKGTQSTFQFNTVTSNESGAGTIAASSISCRGTAEGAWADCSTSDSPKANILFQDNVVYSFINNAYPQSWSGGGTLGTCTYPFCTPTVTDDHNLYYQTLACPYVQTVTSGALPSTNYLCNTDPLLTSAVFSPSFDARLTSSSPARGAGTAVGGITTDFFGNARSSPPSMGALEFGSSPSGYFVLGGVTLKGVSIQ